jgi:hypothetical protein
MIATLAGYTDIVNYLVVEKKANFRRLNLVSSCLCSHECAKAKDM